MDVTDSPLAVYGGFLNNTAYNVQGLLSSYFSDPAPVLRTVLENQLGYLKRVFDLSVVSTAFQSWWNDGTRESLPVSSSSRTSARTWRGRSVRRL